MERFVTDYEKANWAAIRDCFPTAAIKGCLFHYSQAVMRRVKFLGRQTYYGQDEEFTRIIRCIMALPLLPHTHIKHVYSMLRTRATDPLLLRIFDYVRKQWIESSAHPLESVSVYGMSIRTNNDCEGYHNRIREFSHDNLGFYKLSDFLAHEAEIVAINITLVSLEKLTKSQT